MSVKIYQSYFYIPPPIPPLAPVQPAPETYYRSANRTRHEALEGTASFRSFNNPPVNFDSNLPDPFRIRYKWTTPPIPREEVFVPPPVVTLPYAIDDIDVQKNPARRFAFTADPVLPPPRTFPYTFDDQADVASRKRYPPPSTPPEFFPALVNFVAHGELDNRPTIRARPRILFAQPVNIDPVKNNFFPYGWQIEPARLERRAVRPHAFLAAFNIDVVFTPPGQSLPYAFDRIATDKVTRSRHEALEGRSDFASFNLFPMDFDKTNPLLKLPKRILFVQPPSLVETPPPAPPPSVPPALDQVNYQKNLRSRHAGLEGRASFSVLIPLSWGFEAVSLPPKQKLWPRAEMTHGEAAFAIFPRWYDFAFSIQPPQPPARRKVLTTPPIHPEDKFTPPVQPFVAIGGRTIDPPMVRRPARLASMTAGEIAGGLVPFRPYSFQFDYVIKSRPAASRGAALPAAVNIDVKFVQPAPLVPFALGQSFEYVRNKLSRGEALVGRSSFSVLIPLRWGFETISLPPKQKAWPRAEASHGETAFAIYPNWYNQGWEISPPQLFQPRTRRGGSVMVGPETVPPLVFVPITAKYGHDLVPVIRRVPVEKRGAIFTVDPIPPQLRFTAHSWPVQLPPPARRRWDRLGVQPLAGSNAPFGPLVPPPQIAFGWFGLPLGLRQRPLRAVSDHGDDGLTPLAQPVPAVWFGPTDALRRPLRMVPDRGDDGSQFTPLAQPVPAGWFGPPDALRRPLRMVHRGDDGSQFTPLAQLVPFGWFGASDALRHPRLALNPPRGDESQSIVFVPPPLVWGWSNPETISRARWARFGAQPVGLQGLDLPYAPWALMGFSEPAPMHRPRHRRDLGFALDGLSRLTRFQPWAETSPAAQYRRRVPDLGFRVDGLPTFSVAPIPAWFATPEATLRRARPAFDLGLRPDGIQRSAFPVAWWEVALPAPNRIVRRLSTFAELVPPRTLTPTSGWETHGLLLVRPRPNRDVGVAERPLDRFRLFRPDGYDQIKAIIRRRPRPPESTIAVTASYTFTPPPILSGWVTLPIMRYQPNRKYGGALEWNPGVLRRIPGTHTGPNLSFARDFGLFSVTATDASVYDAEAADFAKWKVTAAESVDGTERIMGTYEIDTNLELIGTFADSLSGLAADPGAVTLFLRNPNGGLQTLTYPADLTKTAVGEYIYTFTPTISGTWTYKWQGTGAVVATSPDTTITVKPSTLIAG